MVFISFVAPAFLMILDHFGSYYSTFGGNRFYFFEGS